jgi:hypothetical protein
MLGEGVIEFTLGTAVTLVAAVGAAIYLARRGRRKQ